ncbi:MAG TPA: leucine-rich repeat protein [Erysipelotrichaceae bacterium]|nr:leucine-rich repeat protein [Erysipelotrichaceae bacterium]HQA85682.1 leucine-rich repeat protein [Erysipelotrichaceae bacterium]
MGLFDFMKFEIDGDKLIKYEGSDKLINVPKKVKTIGRYAFAGSVFVENIILPDSVTHIESNAFEYIPVQRVFLSKNLEFIGTECFKYCKNLTEIRIPSSVKELKDRAFANCEALKKVYISEGCEIGENVFEGCSALEEITLPNKYWNQWQKIGLSEEFMYRYKPEMFIEKITDSNKLALNYQTRANLPLLNKKYIFLHYAIANKVKAELLAKNILEYENGDKYAVWMTDNPMAVFHEENKLELSQMAVFIPLITEDYLKMSRNYGVDEKGLCKFSLQKFNQEVTIVIPVFMEGGIESKFNEMFGDLHGIFIGNQNFQMPLQTLLENVLGSDKLNKLINKQAFSKDLFLSYRKKDRQQAIEIMKQIHNTDYGKDAAIWFDDFLMPGEDFGRQIREMLKQADAMILSVTPNLLEKDNYVKNIEYPDAKDNLNKHIIPVEVVTTDYQQLTTDFPGIGEVIPISNKEKLNESLQNVESGNKKKENNPFTMYLLAMAFLTGYRVEKDMERGLKLLRNAAEKSEVHACRHLGFLHLSGRGVVRDFKQTIHWYNKAYELYKQQKDLKSIYELLYGEDGLLLLYMAQDDVPKATSLGKEFLRLLEDNSADDENKEERILWKVRALAQIGDIHFDVNPSEDRLYEAGNYNITALDLLLDYKGDYQDEADRLQGYASFNKGNILLHQGKILGKDYLEMSETIYQKLVDRNPLHQYRKEYSSVLSSLGVLLREEAIYKSRSDFTKSIEFMIPAQERFQKALTIDRQLVKEAPTINNREKLAIALYHCGLVAVDNKESASYLKEALAIVEKLIDETKDKNFNPLYKSIRSVMRRRFIRW